MPQYLISFPSAAMQVSAEDLPEVARAANAVVDDMVAAGVLRSAGGLDESVPPVLVAADGTVTQGTYPQTRDLDGGMTVIEVGTRSEAEQWAAKVAAACRCDQELRELF